MGSAPDRVNYRGEVLTGEMKRYLYGESSTNPADVGQPQDGGLEPKRAAEILQNWMFGIQPKAIDPGETLGEKSKLRPQTERAGVGAGMGGLFGFGKFMGDVPTLGEIKPLGSGPMAAGVPYKVPPLPKFEPGGGSR